MIETYKTSDIILAACLKVSGFELDSIKKVDNGKGVFIFKNVSSEYVAQYDLGKILVEPVNFNNAIKQLTTSVRRMI
jgi:hypothetical protein